MKVFTENLQVTPELRAQYAVLIDEILHEGDLNTISAKQIRKTLSAKLNYDVSSQKVLILRNNARQTQSLMADFGMNRQLSVK
jgi:polyhydroxyalkanoate synthesis regulator phasin